jgi:hypothetical protein
MKKVLSPISLKRMRRKEEMKPSRSGLSPTRPAWSSSVRVHPRVSLNTLCYAWQTPHAVKRPQSPTHTQSPMHVQNYPWKSGCGLLHGTHPETRHKHNQKKNMLQITLQERMRVCVAGTLCMIHA